MKEFIGQSNSYDSKVCSMNQTNLVGVFSVEEVCFCYVYDYHERQNARGQFVLDSANRDQNRFGSIRNGFMKTIPEQFCSVTKLLYRDVNFRTPQGEKIKRLIREA